MADGNTDGISLSSFGTFGSKLNTAGSNRSLVAANQQLRIELAFAKADVSRLQNEIVELQKQIAELESASDEERIEIIVRKRLKQRVQHLKSIANRTVQYMKKTKEDFDRAASRLDHAVLASNSSDNGTGDCSQSGVPCEAGDEIGRNMQRSSTLEAVEEDIYGEMDEDDANTVPDRRPILPLSSDGLERSLNSYKISRNSRRQTLFVKKELDIQCVAESAAVDVMTKHRAPRTACLPRTPAIIAESDEPATSSISELGGTPMEKSDSKNLEVVMPTRKKKKITTDENRRRYEKGSEDNAKATVEINNLLIRPTSAPYIGVLSASNLNEGFRCKRIAAAKISSFKEPNLVSKMRNPNID